MNSSSAASKQIMADQTVDEEEASPEISVSSETSTHHSKSGRGGKNKNAEHDPEAFRRNKIKFTGLIILMGCTVSAAFLAMGIVNAKQNVDEQFVQRTKETVFHVEATWKIYYMFAKWTRESCSRPYDTEYLDEGFESLELGDDPAHHLGFCNKLEFHKIYEYIQAEGLVFQALQFIPNVTNAERPYVEAFAKEYFSTTYKNNSEVNVTGILQYVPDPLPGQSSFEYSDERPYYMPYYHTLPVEGNEEAILFDPLSRSFSKPLYERAVANWEAVMGDRLKLIQETDPNAYSVILRHPGVRRESSPGLAPAVAQIVIRIPDLLYAFTKGLNRNEWMYLYDTTPEVLDSYGKPQYLGAAKSLVDETQVNQITLIPELDMSDIQLPTRKAHYSATEIDVANRKWTVVIVSTNYVPVVTFVIVGGLCIFFATAAIAVWYYRHLSMLEKMATTQNLLTSIFPEEIQDRLLKGDQDENNEQSAFKAGQNKELKAMIGGSDTVPLPTSRPIANLTPEATVLFADIAGFTAWSSTREPFQVFTLLETVFHTFDALAKKRRVYKVETVGDCYVAVTGLPEPRKDHVVCMVRFAKDCLNIFQLVVRQLEVELGPDTADLGVRIGIHSGPITSGVLRGERPRFQLFGDTMNYASRIETTGQKNRIHLSQETAEILIRTGKQHWVRAREEKVFAKGKGTLQTYWADGRDDENKSHTSKTSKASSNGTPNPGTVTLRGVARPDTIDLKTKRLIDWNTSVLLNALKRVVARRKAASIKPDSESVMAQLETKPATPGQTVFDEIVEVIDMPHFDAEVVAKEEPLHAIQLDPKIVQQLTKFITSVTSHYHSNSFHNYEHATHVIMSTTKLLSRIVAPDNMDGNAARIHDHTYGITSDPLTHFAAIFSALIHDMDHPGVANATLVQEETALAKHYKDVSVAEQNSVDLAFQMLMDKEYHELRRAIYSTTTEYKRFRQLVINLVLATDVMDKNIGQERKVRWNKAFCSDQEQARAESHLASNNRKATIILEHLIQASDVAHTMQHWHIYRKWNEKLFKEMYHAYRSGRTDKNPAEFWHKGEIGFLDYYVIPLAKKLETCGVFGVSSAEYLQYATNNRNEWADKGEDVVKELVANAENEYLQMVEEAATLAAVEEDTTDDTTDSDNKTSFSV